MKKIKNYADVCRTAIKNNPFVDNINLLTAKDVTDYTENIYLFTSGELGGDYEAKSERFFNKTITPSQSVLDSLDPIVLRNEVSLFFNDVTASKLSIPKLKDDLKNEIKALRYTPYSNATKKDILSKQKALKLARYCLLKAQNDNKSIQSDNFSTSLVCNNLVYPQGLTLTDHSRMSQNRNDKNPLLSVDETTSIVSFCDLPYILKYGHNNNILSELNTGHKVKDNTDMFLYTNDSNLRSLGDNTLGVRDYTNWNGLIVIDVDLKNDPSFKALSSDEQKIKTQEYINNLKHDLGSHRWLFAIKPSNSDKGIHIYTKVSKPQQTDNDYQAHNIKCYNQFIFNYFHKHAIVSYLLEQYGADLNAEQRGETYDYYKPFERVVTLNRKGQTHSIIIRLENDPSFRSLTDDLKGFKAMEYARLLKVALKSYKWLKDVVLTNNTIKVITNIDTKDRFTGHINVHNILAQHGADLNASQRGETYLVKNKKYGEVIDLHTSSIAQGIRVAPKASTYINTMFVDLPFQITLKDAISYRFKRIEFDEYFTNNKLVIKGMKETLAKCDLLTNKTKVNNAKDKLNNKYQLSSKRTNTTNASNNIDFTLDYNSRYQMVDTVCFYIEDKDEATNILFDVLGVNEGLSDEREILAFIDSAYRGNKRVFKRSLAQLQKLGYKLGLKDNVTIDDVKVNAVEVAKETLNVVDSASNLIYHNNDQYKVDKYITLNNKEYLSHKKDDIISSLKIDKVNYIESMAGTGKTHLFKELSKNNTVCLVLPFTSIITSKIESDEHFKDHFKCYYDNEKSSDVTGFENVCMTLDKFSLLDSDTVNNFDYVVIDEAHLLFNSFYRMKVCSDVLDNISNVVNSNKKRDFTFYNISNIYNPFDPTEYLVSGRKKYIIFMSGTPSNEVNFLSNNNILNYIRIDSTVKHNKVANFILCSDNESKDTHLITKLSTNINNGIKNIVITDKGENYSKPIIKALEKLFNRPIKTSYFKRSLKDDKVNNDIMFNATFDNSLEVLFGSSYLSVGVDIENENEHFNVFFPNNEHTAEDIEQFNNRLRKTNIEAYIYDVVLNSKGEVKDYEDEYKAIINKYFKFDMSLIEDDKKISEHIYSDEDNSIMKLAPLAHKDYMFKGGVYSESLKAINEYFIIHQSKKNIGYIYEQLSNKYQYIVDKIEYKDQNKVYLELLKESRTELKEYNKQLLKQAVISSYSISDINDIKQQNIVFSNDADIQFRDNHLFVNSEYKDFYKAIFNTIKNLRSYYTMDAVRGVLETYNTKNSLDKLNRLIGIKTSKLELNSTSKIIQNGIINVIDDDNTISFIPDNYTTDMTAEQAKILSVEKYDKWIDAVLCNVVEDLNINKDNKLHIPQLRKGIEDTFNLLFDKKRQKGVIYAELTNIPDFDKVTELQEIDNELNDTFGGGVEDTTPSIKRMMNTVTDKRGKKRVVKRLLKDFLKDNELPTISQTVKAIKDAYMAEFGTKLTVSLFKREYKDVYKSNSNNQITGLK